MLSPLGMARKRGRKRQRAPTRGTLCLDAYAFVVKLFYLDRRVETPPFCESAVTVNGPAPCTIHFTRTMP